MMDFQGRCFPDDLTLMERTQDPWFRRSGATVQATRSPGTLRRTMLTWLAGRGVPKEQRMAIGHKPQDYQAENYDRLTRDYLQAAVHEIDAFFDELTKHTDSHLRYSCDTREPDARAA